MQKIQAQAGDGEPASLEQLAAQASGPDAQHYFAEGQKLLAGGSVAEGIDYLRKAVELDNRDRSMRAAFLNALLEQARTRLSRDWRESQLLVREALKFDGSNPLARSLLAQIQQREHQALVEACACEARELQAVGNLQGALDKVRQALDRHPRESRLSQLESMLLSKLGGRARPRSQETQAARAQAPQPERRASVQPAPEARVSGAASLPPAQAAPGRSTAQPSEPAIPKQTIVLPPSAPRTTAAASGKIKFPRWSRRQWAIVAAVPLLLSAAFAAYKLIRARRSAPVTATTELRANVSGAKFLLDGKPVDPPVVLTPGREHVLEASREGYESSIQKVTPLAGQAMATMQFLLRPLLPRFQVWSDLQGARVSLGKQPAAAIANGRLDIEQVAAGTQTVKVFDDSGQIFELSVKTEPGQAVDITGPVDTKDYSVAVASILGTHARIFASKDLKGGVEGQKLQPIPAEGIELEIKTALVFQLSNEETIKLEPGNQPSVILSITARSGETEVRSNRQMGHLFLSSIPGDAEIHVDGENRGPATATGTLEVPLSPAAHKIYLSRPHFEDSQTITVNLGPGQTEKISGERFTLVRQGALVFKINPASATVTYQLAETQQAPALRKAVAGETVWVKPGKYLIRVEAQGFAAEQDQYEVRSGASLEVTRSLKPLATETPAATARAVSGNDPFEDVKQWTRSGSWWVFRKESYGWLKSRDGIFDVTMQRPKKPFYAVWPQGGKKVEWTIDNRDGDKLVYSITNHTFHRTAYRDGKPVSEQTVELKKHPKDYKVTFEVSARHIIVSEAVSGKLDDFERPDPSVQLGKIGFRGEIAVTVQQK